MKKIVMIMTAGVLAIMMSGCDTPQVIQEQALPVMSVYDETLVIAETVVEDDVITETDENPATETTNTGTQAEPMIPQNRIAITTPTVKPTNTATPTPSVTTEQDRINTPAVTEPEPTQPPETTPTPTPQPQQPPQQPPPANNPPPNNEPPPPIVVEPPPARTICNTCGADITGNVPAHGTMHLHNGENFSYRVE